MIIDAPCSDAIVSNLNSFVTGKSSVNKSFVNFCLCSSVVNNDELFGTITDILTFS